MRVKIERQDMKYHVFGSDYVLFVRITYEPTKRYLLRMSNPKSYPFFIRNIAVFQTKNDLIEFLRQIDKGEIDINALWESAK